MRQVKVGCNQQISILPLDLVNEIVLLLTMSKTKLGLSPFLQSWAKQALPRYEAEFGGSRAGVPKGDPIPFPTKKLVAAFYMLIFNPAGPRGLSLLADVTKVKEGVLRVWRTEKRFRQLYRQMVWEAADAFVRHLVQDEKVPTPTLAKEYWRLDSLVLQTAIMYRCGNDILGRSDAVIQTDERLAREWRIIATPAPPPLSVTDIRVERILAFVIVASARRPIPEGMSLQKRIRVAASALSLLVSVQDLIQMKTLVHLQQAIDLLRNEQSAAALQLLEDLERAIRPSEKLVTAGVLEARHMLKNPDEVLAALRV